MESSLKQRAISGMIWTALQKYSNFFIQFISGVILARLLTPYDYGCIGMLTIFIALSQTFIDGGFGSALIQKKRPNQEDYSTIFWWNIGIAILVYAILFAFAPSIAKFYNIPVLTNILRIYGLTLFIYAFNIIQKNQLRKILNFKVLSIVSITTSIIALLVSIGMAYNGFGVWSLVTQNILSSAIPAVVFWFTLQWRPSLVFSTKSFKELFGFGLYMFLTNFINNFSSRIQGLIIGKVYNPITLGYYSKADGVEQLASEGISQIIMQVTYPLYAEIQEDKDRLSKIIKQITIMIAYFSFPLMFILLLCAEPLFLILYSDIWLQSVPYFQILCIAGLANCLHAVNILSIAAIGRSRAMFGWSIIKRIIGLCYVIGGLLLFGIKGLLIGVVLNTWFCYFVNIGMVSKYIGYKWWQQLKHLSPILLMSISAAFVSYMVSIILSQSVYWDGIIRLLIYVTSYLIGSRIFKLEAFNLLKAMTISHFYKTR